MSRWIDGDWLLNFFEPYPDNYQTPLGTLRACVDDAPSIEPKRGEWIDMGDFEQCSVCKGTRLKEFQSYYGKTTWIKTPYCPNCGADMRKESE